MTSKADAVFGPNQDGVVLKIRHKDGAPPSSHDYEVEIQGPGFSFTVETEDPSGSLERFNTSFAEFLERLEGVVSLDTTLFQMEAHCVATGQICLRGQMTQNFFGAHPSGSNWLEFEHWFDPITLKAAARSLNTLVD